MEQIKLSIPKPCNRSWANMQQTRDGKFCSHCTTEVIDFSKLTTAELKTWFSANNGKVCGYFHESQIQKLNGEANRQSNWRSFRVKLLLASCFAMLTTTKGFSVEPSNKIQETFQRQKNSGSIVSDNFKSADTVIEVNGIVKDMEGIRISGVIIKEKNSSKSVASNVNGEFSMTLKVNQNQFTTLVFSYPGYETKELTITTANFKNLVVTLSENTKVMGEVVIVSTRTTWEKIKLFFRKIF